jgi:hypothetical protein
LPHDYEIDVGGDMLSLFMREQGGGFLHAVQFAERLIGQASHELERPSKEADKEIVDGSKAF